MQPEIVLITIVNFAVIIISIVIIYKFLKKLKSKQTTMENISVKLDNLQKQIDKLNLSNKKKIMNYNIKKVSTKHIKLICIILFLLGVGIFIYHQQQVRTAKENTVIVFKDKNLEQAIRMNIRKKTGDILQKDLDNIIDLSACNKNISDISSIENCRNLELLALSENNISDIKPLESMTKLIDLHLESNNIVNIEPLRNLTHLLGLSLKSNPIKDYSPIKAYYKNLQSQDFYKDF